MIDIHCHILYGIDDGADDLDESIAMARLAYEDGIHHIFATPHFNKNHINHREVVLNKVQELQNKLDDYNIPVTIYPSNEVRLESASFIYEHANNFSYLGPSSKFILLEQKWKDFSEDTFEIIGWFLQKGVVPIIPHPERHFFFRKNPKLLRRLIEEGCWTQVSVDSLLGKNTEDALVFSRWLIEQNYVHTLATDAHNIHRKPNLSTGFKIIEETVNKQRANEIRARMEQILV